MCLQQKRIISGGPLKKKKLFLVIAQSIKYGAAPHSGSRKRLDFKLSSSLEVDNTDTSRRYFCLAAGAADVLGAHTIEFNDYVWIFNSAPGFFFFISIFWNRGIELGIHLFSRPWSCSLRVTGRKKNYHNNPGGNCSGRHCNNRFRERERQFRRRFRAQDNAPFLPCV